MKGLIITYLLTYGGAAAGVFNPYLGLLVYVAFSILKPASLWYWSVPVGPYSKIIAGGFLIGWVLRGFGKWNFGRAGAIVLAIGGYLLWTFVCYLAAPDKTVAWNYFDEMTKIILPFFVGMTTIDSVRKLKQLAWVIVCCEGYVALEMNQSYLEGFNRLQEEGFGWMDNNCNAIAMVTCMGLALFLALGAPRWWQKGVALGFALLLAHGVFLSFSRGGMLGLGVTGLATFLLIRKKPRHYLFFVLAVLVVLRMAGKEVQERFSTTFAEEKERDGSSEMRLKHWRACRQSILANPILGVGPAHWHLVSPTYGLPPMEAHSLWLQLTAELGLPGFGFLALFYLICVQRLWAIRHDNYVVPDPWLHDAARMVIAALTGFIVSAQFVSMQGLEIPYYICMFGAGVLKVVSNAETARRASERSAPGVGLTRRQPWNPVPAMAGAPMQP
jgi:putative inorganic carbon (hco3(-)) transporter